MTTINVPAWSPSAAREAIWAEIRAICCSTTSSAATQQGLAFLDAVGFYSMSCNSAEALREWISTNALEYEGFTPEYRELFRLVMEDGR